MISELVVVGVAGNGRQLPMCDMEVEQVAQVTGRAKWLPKGGLNGRANGVVGDKEDKIATTGWLMLGKLANVASSLMRLAKVLFVSTLGSSWLTIFDWLLSHKDIVTLDW